MLFPANHVLIPLFSKPYVGQTFLPRPAVKINKLAFDVEVLGDRLPLLSKTSFSAIYDLFFCGFQNLHASQCMLIYISSTHTKKKYESNMRRAYCLTNTHYFLKPCAGCINTDLPSPHCCFQHPQPSGFFQNKDAPIA